MPTPSRARTRAALATRQDLVLRVSLRDIVPEIWRTVRVPREYTLAQLHRTLQLVFAWQDYHLHRFEIGGRRFEAPDEEAEGESTAIRLTELPLATGDRFLYRGARDRSRGPALAGPAGRGAGVTPRGLWRPRRVCGAGAGAGASAVAGGAGAARVGGPRL
jgi:hypothetical protein